MPARNHSSRIQRAITYINTHLAELDGPRDVADSVEVSYSTLRKQFRQEVGVTLGRYITQARVDRARRLLVETDMAVYVVCTQVGFSSDSLGIRIFKRHTGMTMGEYRREYRTTDAG